MADITTFDGLINAHSNNLVQLKNFDGYLAAAGTAMCANTFGTLVHNIACTSAMPSPLPGSVTKYRPLGGGGYSSVASWMLLVCKAINLGSLDISGASGTFTDGSTFPTRTELGTANVQTYGPIFAEVTTGLNATPGTFTVTYKDQAGASQTTAAVTLTASATAHMGCILNLVAGSSGAQDITAAARAAGTTPTGVIKFWGLLPLFYLPTAISTTTFTDNVTTGNFNFPELGAGDNILILNMSTSAGAGREIGMLKFMGEV